MARDCSRARAPVRLALYGRSLRASTAPRGLSCTISAMRRVRIIFAVTALVCYFASLSAQPVAQLHPSNYVNDFAHVLSADAETQLNDICKQIDEKAHAQIAVVTVNSLDGRDVEGYAVDLFKQWGVGSKSTDKGVLVLVAVQDHRDRIEVGYGLEPILPDGKVGGFMREAVPSFKS